MLGCGSMSAQNGAMSIRPTSDGQLVAECPRCDATVATLDAEWAAQWMAAHWRIHDGEIGCGRRGPV